MKRDKMYSNLRYTDHIEIWFRISCKLFLQLYSHISHHNPHNILNRDTYYQQADGAVYSV